MGKARIAGNNAYVFLHSYFLNLPIPLGEIDGFQAKSLSTIHKTRPIGYTKVGATPRIDGWELTFDGGKVDWSLAHFIFMQDMMQLKKEEVPKFSISHSIIYYTGITESYIFEDVSLFGLDLNTTQEEIKETIQGFASVRKRGILDTTWGDLSSPTNAIRMALMKLPHINIPLIGSIPMSLQN